MVGKKLVLIPAVGGEAPRLKTLKNPPTQPKDGIAHNYAELVWLLRQARESRGLTRSELDAATEWDSGRTQKLENPQGKQGQSAVREDFNWWLSGLGVGLELVLLDASSAPKLPLGTRSPSPIS